MIRPAPTAGPVPLAIPWSPGDAASAAGPADAATGWPPGDWPSAGQLSYTRELITVVLLVVALPWIVMHLARNPRKTSQAIAGKAL